MTDDEIDQLAQLLRKLSQEGLVAPRLPSAVFAALKGVVAQPTVEILVSRDGLDVLLTRRHDQHWSTWHLPGGFVGAGETLEAACDRIARRELGCGAALDRLIGHYTWREHPYALPLSLLCVCRLDAEPQEGRYFDVLPDELMAEHRHLLQAYWPDRR